LIVNGSARAVGWFSRVIRVLQSGYIYHYAFVMILGVLGFLIYFLPFPSFAN
jgi:NADH-quinone oxidoreductase subunit L